MKELQRERLDLSVQLFVHGNKMWREHKEKLVKYMRSLQKYCLSQKIESTHGEHFAICCWSDDKCTKGPDTCECVSFEILREEAIFLHKLYQYAEFG